MSNTDLKAPVEPGLTLCGLEIRVHGREFPELDDAWDGNWLRITATCSDSGASVTVSGCLLDTVSFLLLMRDLMKLYEQLEGRAVLESVEPNIHVEFASRDRLGHISVCVHITPDHMTQRHQFEFTIDQTWLPPLIAQCEHILKHYPVLNPEGRGV